MSVVNICLHTARLLALTLDTSSSYSLCRNSNVVRRALAADCRRETLADTLRASVFRVRDLSISPKTLGFWTWRATLATLTSPALRFASWGRRRPFWEGSGRWLASASNSRSLGEGAGGSGHAGRREFRIRAMRSSTAVSTGGSAVELEGASFGVYRRHDGSGPTAGLFL